jgi:hypothetical protein
MSVKQLSTHCVAVILATLMLLVAKSFRPDCPVLAQGQQDVDICDLTAHADRFNKKQIRVHARLETVVIEGGMWLVGDSCSKEMVGLDVPKSMRRHPEQHPDYAALRDAILKEGNVGTAGKSITATFPGKFVYNRHKRPKRTLLLEKIESLETTVYNR